MNKPVASFALITALTASAGAASAAEQLKHFAREVPVSSQRTLEIEGKVGEITLEAYSGNSVRVDVVVRCERDRKRALDDCRARGQSIDLGTRNAGDALVLEVQNFPKTSSDGLSVDLRIKAPAGLNVKVGHGVGNVEVTGMTGDVRVDLGVGEVEASLPAKAVHDVELSSGVGNVELRREGERLDGSGFVGKSLEWRRGAGDGRIDLNTGVGNVSLRLD